MAGASLGGRGPSGRRQTRLRGSLVVAQVAFSMVLLLGAGLLMRTFVNLVTVDFGFDPANLLVAGVSFPPTQNASAADQLRFYRETLTRLSAVPGVRSVAVTSGPPPFGGTSTAVQVQGGEMSPQPTTVLAFGSERLVETVGLSLLRGRGFDAPDVTQMRHVAVVNETFARKYFGADDALGRSVRLARLATLPVPVADPTVEIVGVVRDARNQGPRDAVEPQVFVPFTLRGPGAFSLAIRTTGNPLAFVSILRREIRAIDPQVAIADPTALEDLIARVFYARPRFSLLILGIFAATGIVLVAFGVYGVLAYTVSQQSREIAIRMALGGARRDVVAMVLRAGLRLVGGGLVAGLAAGVATNRLLVGQLWNTSPHDPMTLFAAVAVVVVIGVCACWVPARRAVRVEPMVALRHE
jgi:putative ABC transport system permease protein